MSGISQSSLNELSIGTNPTITNVTIPTANTEVQITLPQNVKMFRLSVKDQSCAYEISFTSGGTTYKFSPGETYLEREIITESLDLYITLTKANKIIQILYWI